MPIQLDPSLPAPLVPLAWLIGTWQGAGVIGYPTMQESRFGQEIEFRHEVRDVLTYRSTVWLLDAEGERREIYEVESGYWRPTGEAIEGGTALEVLLTHPAGVVEIYVGRVYGARADLETDVVARTATADEYSAATRMYGLVEGDLLWAYDVAAYGHPLQSRASARLKRV
jgi:hypothetical protein